MSPGPMGEVHGGWMKVAGEKNGLASRESSQLFKHRVLHVSSSLSFAPSSTKFSTPSPTFVPPMAASSGGLWICTECGKVCKSRGGLAQHSSVHKRHRRIGELGDNARRVYHPQLDGISSFISC